MPVIAVPPFLLAELLLEWWLEDPSAYQRSEWPMLCAGAASVVGLVILARCLRGRSDSFMWIPVSVWPIVLAVVLLLFAEIQAWRRWIAPE